MLKRIFGPGNNAPSANFALLVLRLWIGFMMLLNHGVGKLANFHDMALSFPDPLGVGHQTSMALATFAEFFASMLVIGGLLTRWAALVLAIDMTVAFLAVHKTVMSGPHGGGLAFMYLMGYVTLMLAGPGAISLDKIVFGKKRVKAAQ